MLFILTSKFCFHIHLFYHFVDYLYMFDISFPCFVFRVPDTPTEPDTEISNEKLETQNIPLEDVSLYSDMIGFFSITYKNGYSKTKN